ncbi:hypothetical protein [Pelagerythrobacter sp.]|uniref:hypothetical protein n=1 Tax=Pelagerythrobacter sp. TaxID=2800702 RepID=UPI0035AF6E1D
MKTLTKALVGTIAAGGLAMTAATPAMAQYRDYDRDDGIGVGEVIAGAAIIGGIAALAGAFDNNDRDRYDNRYYRTGYDRGYNSRAVIERCVAAAETNARRYGYRAANVTQIRDVDTNRDNVRIKGRIDVGRSYGRSYGYDRNRGYDSGDFTCRVDYSGRVYDLDYSGIRGL